MGDHRIGIKISFSMHGHEKALDAWWNFSERDVPGVDYRLVEWLQEQHEIAMGKYLETQCAAGEREQAEQENRERDDLARLREKYDDR